jgi:phosphodiesterase/alkaline phosphatase D-like protein
MTDSPFTLRRRTLLKASAAAGVVAATPLSLPGAALAQTPPSGVFAHGVASGDPLGTAVVIWTRVTPTPDAAPGSGSGPQVPVSWEVAADPAFTTVLQRGSVTTDAARDHTVKVDVTGLEPYTRYWYRFTALGATSPPAAPRPPRTTAGCTRCAWRSSAAPTTPAATSPPTATWPTATTSTSCCTSATTSTSTATVTTATARPSWRGSAITCRRPRW